MKVAYIFVVSDFLHLGILQFIKEAKKNSDYLICGILTDSATVEIRGELPINSYEDRLNVLNSIKYIDEVIEQDTFSPVNNIKQLLKKYPTMSFFYGKNIGQSLNLETLDKLNIICQEVAFESRYSDEKIAKKIYSSSLIHKNIELFENTFLNNNTFKYHKYNSKNIFSTKAGTLRNISNLLKKSRIEKAYVFRVIDYNQNQQNIIKEIQQYFKNETLIIRSSALNEDTEHESKAGYYDSVLDVASNSIGDIVTAINGVIQSYKKNKHNYLYNEILVQKQTKNVLISGVLLTTDLEMGLPYYMVNYTFGNKTDIITGGLNNAHTKIISKFVNSKILPKPFNVLISAIKEIEQIIRKTSLDIEFAVTNDLKIVIFQIRPLVKTQIKKYTTNKVNIDLIRKTYASKLFLSDMAFWNPAELIGNNPKPLACSLFQEVITKFAWNKGLQNIGYPKCEKNLLKMILNKPYIDLTLSFKALIPKDISKEIAKKLEKFYKYKLLSNPSFHDKIEFEIVLSHIVADFDMHAKELIEFSFTSIEIESLRKALIKTTSVLVNNYTEYREESLKRINNLIKLQKNYAQNNILDIKSLINDCVSYGTVPFSQVARIAFISKSILMSFEKAGILSQVELKSLQELPHTILSELNNDIKQLVEKTMTKKEFNSKYGHLRAGTYDICSKKYSDINEFNKYIIPKLSTKTNLEMIGIKINKYFKMHHIDICFNDFFHMYLCSTEDREYFKYIYTKNISLILDILIDYGKKNGISKEELSFLNIEDIEILLTSKENIIKYLNNQKKRFYKQTFIKLPQIISSQNDLEYFDFIDNQINFIGTTIINAQTIFITAYDTKVNLENKIVIIENADPGFHWIFSKNIKGLVTKYGGVASHMAICCNEFGITAAIGCGDYFEKLKIKNFIEINPNEKRIW